MKFADNREPWIIEGLDGSPWHCLAFGYLVDEHMKVDASLLSAAGPGRLKQKQETEGHGSMEGPDWMRKVQTYD